MALPVARPDPVSGRVAAVGGRGDRVVPVVPTWGGHPAERELEGPSPQPLRLRPWISYRKEEVFEICGALALAEALLSRSGREVDASRMAAVFDLVEAGLVRPAVPAADQGAAGSE
jgi:hypothetical protein